VPPIKRALLEIVCAVAIAGAGVLVFAGVAGASPSATTAAPAAQSPTSQLICSSAGSTGSATADSYLPATRWAGAISKQHTRLSGGFLGVGDIGQVVQRNVFVGGATAIGASEWKLGIAATEMASQFCFANSVGNTADTLAGGLGNAIEQSGIIAALVALAIVIAIWKLSRGQQKQWGKVFRLLVIVGIFVVIVASSTGATGTAAPPRLSPGGIIDTVYGAISNFANGPTNAVATAASNAINTTHSTTVANQDPLDCSWYTQALVTKYKQSYGVGNTSYSVPVGLNAMWEQAAIPAYTSEQFGAQNNFGPLVYCHLLEDQAGVPPQTQLDIERATGKTSAAFPLTQPLANPWYGGRTNTYEDASLVAWAACQSPTGAALQPTEWNLTTGQQLTTSEWTMIKNPAQRGGGTQITTTDCRFWWVAKANGGGASGYTTTGTVKTLSSQTFNPEKSPFNWTTNAGNITSAVAQISTKKLSTGAQAGAGIANYLNNLHGTTNADAEATAIVFFLSSTVVMLVFLILAAALMIAKLALLVSMVLLPIMLLLALFPGSLSSRLPGYLKHLLSLIIFATCAGILLSLVALVTALVADLGTAIGGRGSIVALLWVAISPVASVVIIHHFFKKVLKAPSPFTPSAALAYGAAAGGFAGGAGAGLLDMSAVKGMIRSQAKNRFGGGGQTGGSSSGTRPGTRRGGMEPGTGPGQGKGGTGTGTGPDSGKGRGGRGTNGAPNRPTDAEKAQAKEERRAARQWARTPANAGSTAGRAAAAAMGGAAALAGAAMHPVDRARRFSERVRSRVAKEHGETEASSGKHASAPKTAAAKLLRGVRVQGRIVRKGAMRAGKVAAVGAGKAAVTVGRHPVKTAKYAAMGIGAIGLMAAPPVAAGVGAAYAAKKIYNVGRPRAWKARSANRLDRYREAQREEAPPDGGPAPNRPTPPSEQGPPLNDDYIDSFDSYDDGYG
jgi:hypothetical protein